MAKKKTWAEMSSSQRALVVAGTVAELALSAWVSRDLRSRPAAQVRGPKLLWHASLVVQPIGPLAYLAIGRR